MGGTGAKSRRRLKRQTNSSEDVATGTGRNDQVVDRVNKAEKVGGTANSRSPFRNPAVNAIKTNAKKPKVKKPKHLKRKLEALEGEDASGEKERLLMEMQMWQENKNKFQKQKQTTKQNNNLIAKEEKHNDEPESFPRSGDNDDGENPSPQHEDPEVSSNVKHKQQPRQQQASQDDKNDSDSDSDDSLTLPKEAPIRQRGKRRRGRKDTSQKVYEQQQEQTITQDSTSKDSADKESNTTDSLDKFSLDENPSKKRQKTQTNDNRYCKGRKPVTDFVIGQSYAGEVVYVKPFGIFLDIGCHSDAFCHVSRLQDDYVESAESLFHPGDVVQAARVIEIDRAKKRITVSLQSNAMREMELHSIEARKGRKGKREERTSSSAGSGKSRRTFLSADTTVRSNVASDSAKEQTVVMETARKDSPANFEMETKTMHVRSDQLTTNHSSPAELKRARKVARRAARRAQQEISNHKGPKANQ